MREKFIKFMQGRYGADQLGKFTSGIVIVTLLLTLIIRDYRINSILSFLGLLALIITYMRMFSKNISKRYRENQEYLAKTAKIRTLFMREKNLMAQRKTHHIYKCPGCGQKIRIPKGKGKIEISCPKCATKFVKRS
ncbi:MAG: hypothetical protein Q4B47_00025 [Eubacteriales bacterium]|nr:hypothetical protein [Eubacteriales bacterium]